MSWICPHCGTTATLQPNNVSSGSTLAAIDTAPNKDGIVISWFAVKCPAKACRKYTLDIGTNFGEMLVNTNGYRTGKTTGDTDRLIGIGKVRIEPRVGSPLSPTVPSVVKEDYEEAYLIKDLSPKASATLCRRALQGMIRDFWGVSKSRLHDELEAIKSQCDPDLFEAMMGLKSIGNIGAHPEKDISIIVDVDEGEPDALLELLRILDKEWYVAKVARLERLSAVKNLGLAKAALQKPSAAALPAPPSSL
jgi:hypothetical protein